MTTKNILYVDDEVYATNINNTANTTLGSITTGPLGTSYIMSGAGGNGGIGMANGAGGISISTTGGTSSIYGPAIQPSIFNGYINDPYTTIKTRLDKIEKVLNMITNDIKLEEKYPRLKELSDEYDKLVEQYSTWEKLK